MTLNEFLDVIDCGRDSEIERIQICKPDGNWDDVDEVLTSSCLLVPFGDLKIEEIGAIKEDVFRVSLNWTAYFEKKKEEQKKEEKKEKKVGRRKKNERDDSRVDESQKDS